MALILKVKDFTIFVVQMSGWAHACVCVSVSICACVCRRVYNFPEFFTFRFALFFFNTKYQKKHFLKINCVQKKNNAIICWIIISFTLNRLKALVTQTFVEHSLWICQASVLTCQTNSRVVQLFTLVYWLHSCPWTTDACLLPGRQETQLLQAAALPDREQNSLLI